MVPSGCPALPVVITSFQHSYAQVPTDISIAGPTHTTKSPSHFQNPIQPCNSSDCSDLPTINSSPLCSPGQSPLLPISPIVDQPVTHPMVT